MPSPPLIEVPGMPSPPLIEVPGMPSPPLILLSVSFSLFFLSPHSVDYSLLTHTSCHLYCHFLSLILCHSQSQSLLQSQSHSLHSHTIMPSFILFRSLPSFYLLQASIMVTGSQCLNIMWKLLDLMKRCVHVINAHMYVLYILRHTPHCTSLDTHLTVHP